MPLLTIFTCLLVATRPAQDAEAVYKKVLPSVMTLKVALTDGGTALGTAFLAMKDGVAVTAWHVVKDATGVVAKFSDGEEFEVSGLIDRDEKRDLALIKVKVADKALLSFAAAEPNVGSKAYSIGAPRGLEFSISDGLISGIRQIDGFKQFQYTCPTSPGNSGGPIVNGDGQVLGVVSWQLRDSQNLNFAIAYNYVKGLDASLSTKAWSEVKPSTTPTFSPDGDDVKNAVKVMDLRVKANVHIAAAYDYMRETTRVSPNHLQIPSSLYSAIDELPRVARDIRKLRFSDSEINEAVENSAEQYERAADGFEDLKLAALAAMRTGWDNYASSLMNKGYSSVFAVGAWAKAAPKVYKLIPESDRKKYPEDVVKAIFSDEPGLFGTIRKMGFILDIRLLPKVIVSIAQLKSPASEADVRPSDEILTVDGKDVVGWTQFDQMLSASAGSTVTLKVRRMKGGDATLKLKVPKS